MKKLVGIVLLTLVAIKIAAILVRGPIPIELDAESYWRLSDLVLRGDVLMLNEQIAYRTPIYPWFLALARSVSPMPLLTIVTLQGLMWLASVGIAGWIAVRISRQPTAFAWTMVAALPGVSAIVYMANVLTESLFVFLMMVHLLAMLDYAKHDSKRRLLWMVITFALTLLTRPIVILLWVPHVLFCLIIHYRRRRRLGIQSPHRVKLHHRIGHAGLAAVVIGVMASPWLIRNHHLFGKPCLTEFVGRNAWVVTFREGSGAGLSLPNSDASEKLQRRLGYVKVDIDDKENWQNTWVVSNALVKSGLNDVQTDQLMKQVARDAILENRGTFAWKALRRCANYWRCAALDTDLPKQLADVAQDPNLRGEPHDKFFKEETWQYRLPGVGWVIQHRLSQSVWGNTILTVLIGAATLLLIVWRISRPYGIWIAMVLGYFCTVTGTLEIPDYRYRMIVEPICMIAFGAAAAMLFSKPQTPDGETS